MAMAEVLLLPHASVHPRKLTRVKALKVMT